MAQPFQIHISEEIITDLNNRIAATRWPDDFDNDKWEWGTNGVLTFRNYVITGVHLLTGKHRKLK